MAIMRAQCTLLCTPSILYIYYQTYFDVSVAVAFLWYEIQFVSQKVYATNKQLQLNSKIDHKNSYQPSIEVKDKQLSLGTLF